MNKSISRVLTGLKLLFPSPKRIKYASLIRKSGMFDKNFYLGVNQNMHWLSKLFPIRHYVLMGEAMGLQPNPEFSPSAYLFLNADVQNANIAPLKHYIEIGSTENRPTRDLGAIAPTADLTGIPVIRPVSSDERTASFAIYVHVFYADLWPEFAKVIRSQVFDFDLFVTCTVGDKQDNTIASAIKAEFPKAHVYEIPNHGRDIFPFVHLINSGVFLPYKAVCKLHTKKSPHRTDGDTWRRHLTEGILGDPDLTVSRLTHFLEMPEALFWVADGQFYDDTRWWGSNQGRVAELMRRLEYRVDPSSLSFPAGSIYWVKPLALDMIKGLQLTYLDFEPEHGQVDGTTAHAIERVLGYIAKASGQSVVQASELDQKPVQDAAIKPRFTSAFYLPQFHPTPKNDQWWGEGFTEWFGVTRAKPAFPGHVQPALPTDLGFYDLRLPETMKDQAILAKDVGIDAFCVYHYWFDGQRILEQPLDNLMDEPDIDFPFYLCWANESWRRNWDGLSGEVLMDQSYQNGFAGKLANDLVPYFKDPRYQRPDGSRPRFVIYRPEDMPDPAGAVREMRATWRESGIGEVELGAVRFHIEGEHKFDDDLFDFWIEMPPHGLVTSDDYLFGGAKGNQLGFETNPGFSGLIYDYYSVVENSVSTEYLKKLPKNTIAGIMPSWDNTARRGLYAHIAFGANPGSFNHWLNTIQEKRLPNSYRNELFINSWNEWAEKAMLEPTQQYGNAYLRCVSAAIGGKDN